MPSAPSPSHHHVYGCYVYHFSVMVGFWQPGFPTFRLSWLRDNGDLMPFWGGSFLGCPCRHGASKKSLVGHGKSIYKWMMTEGTPMHWKIWTSPNQRTGNELGMQLLAQHHPTIPPSHHPRRTREWLRIQTKRCFNSSKRSSQIKSKIFHETANHHF